MFIKVAEKMGDLLFYDISENLEGVFKEQLSPSRA